MSHVETLQDELETFQRQLPALKAEFPTSYYAVIIGTVCLGAFATYKDALARGYEKAPTPQFLVKQIGSDDEVQCVVTPL